MTSFTMQRTKNIASQFKKGAFSQDKSRFVTRSIAYVKSCHLQKAIDFNHSSLTFCSTEYGVNKAFVKNFQGLRNRSVKGSLKKKLYVKRWSWFYIIYYILYLRISMCSRWQVEKGAEGRTMLTVPIQNNLTTVIS